VIVLRDEAVLSRPTGARFLESGDEAGTAPEDRKFRPDVQGLRAVAVLLVVLYHAGLSRLGGGYVGVDVFFVISGFVITGVLLRERAALDNTSILAFYGRRCRRIIPAASLVIIVTIVLSYVFLGFLSGNRTATDGRWASIFFANFHFSSEGTNYLSSQALPSPLQNFWSLSVEEQFYLVYPTLFLLVASMRTRISLRLRLAIGLGLVIIVSFVFSVIQTSSDPTVAYFSPLTRAWELALGALVAVGTTWLLRIPRHMAAAATWVGLGAILISAFAFNSQTAYPGSLVAIPVVGAALIIAAGAGAPRFGAESLLRLPPFAWLGNLSYSLYLWHWPILIIAAESRGKAALPFSQNLGWLALALAASFITYNLVENPIRHAKALKRTVWASIVLGVGLVVATLAVATVSLHDHSGPTATPADNIAAGSDLEVMNLVDASTKIQDVPADLTPTVLDAPQDVGWPPSNCAPTLRQTTLPPCVFGDPHGTHTMVLYGDSHALMWFQAVDRIATQAHWRLIMLGKGYCMANKYPTGPPSGPLHRLCGEWQQFAVTRIKNLDPDLVLVTQEVQAGNGKKPYTGAQWQNILEEGLRQMAGPRTKFVVLGNIPNLGQSPPDCLAQHPKQVQACSGPPDSNLIYNQAEQRGVTAVGGRYINVVPWFCTTSCSAVIGHFEVYVNQLHLTRTYSLFLEHVLAEKLDLSRYSH
jgi:peptidoglycan/LPS O-acetylase OafA/YrhL